MILSGPQHKVKKEKRCNLHVALQMLLEPLRSQWFRDTGCSLSTPPAYTLFGNPLFCKRGETRRPHSTVYTAIARFACRLHFRGRRREALRFQERCP